MSVSGPALPEGLRLRPATDDDGPFLVELLGACWGEYPDMVLDSDDEMAHLNRIASHYAPVDGEVYLVVAEPDTTSRGPSVVASVAFRPLDDDGSVELQLLYVMPGQRRQGLAASLVGFVESRARARGFRRIELWSDTRFGDAHRRYRSLGYAQLPESRDLPDLSKSTELHFEKALGG